MNSEHIRQMGIDLHLLRSNRDRARKASKDGDNFEVKIYLELMKANCSNLQKSIDVLQNQENAHAQEISSLLQEISGLRKELKESEHRRQQLEQDKLEIGKLAVVGPSLPVCSNLMELNSAFEVLERQLVESALEQSGGNQLQAAKLLGIKRTTLHEKISRMKTVLAGNKQDLENKKMLARVPESVQDEIVRLYKETGNINTVSHALNIGTLKVSLVLTHRGITRSWGGFSRVNEKRRERNAAADSSVVSVA